MRKNYCCESNLASIILQHNQNSFKIVVANLRLEFMYPQQKDVSRAVYESLDRNRPLYGSHRLGRGGTPFVILSTPSWKLFEIVMTFN